MNWINVYEIAGKVWPILGPFAGLLLGAWLSRSGDRRKWLNDNRASECRDIIKAFATTIDLMFVVQRNLASNTPDRGETRARDYAYNECLKILQDRIFVWKDIQKHHVQERWVNLVRDYSLRKDHRECQRAYEEIRKTIVEMAMRG